MRTIKAKVNLVPVKEFSKEELAEHDNQVREKAVDDFAEWLVKQEILGNRVISDGEMTDYGKVYAKEFKEQNNVRNS